MDKKEITPTGARVAAIKQTVDQMTSAGLYLPTNEEENPLVAVVTAVGPDVLHLSLGDKIIYKEYATTDLKLDDVEYLIVNEEDVLATLKGE